MAAAATSAVVFDRDLTKADGLVLRCLAADIQDGQGQGQGQDQARDSERDSDHREVIATLEAMNDPHSKHFEPTVFTSLDVDNNGGIITTTNKDTNEDTNTSTKLPGFLLRWCLPSYVRIARSVVRVDTDVVMLTHLLLYLTTSVPSALFLFLGSFTWVHGLLHFVMQASYIGSYTLMMHQHIHMRGILSKRFALLDALFPYVTDPLMGHTWNSYFYHHVKHHHVEGNGPDDLSSTMRYQRDELAHFLHYVGRFYFFIWLELPLYFIRKGRWTVAAKAAFWELSEYALLYGLFQVRPHATFCVLLLPLMTVRLGLMVGNWGQHALVDHSEPDSDYRSSITLIDVPSNRHCFNDGYHTSHHLNPLRHWREHPVSFLKSKDTYAKHHALVFHNIDYIMITVRLLMKDYRTLAECMVPIGEEQIRMTMEERMALLRDCTRRFSEEEIRKKYGDKRI